MLLYVTLATYLKRLGEQIARFLLPWKFLDSKKKFCDVPHSQTNWPKKKMFPVTSNLLSVKSLIAIN